MTTPFTSHRAAFLSGELRKFTQEILAELPRVDQRRWGRIYIEGLLTVSGRKSIRRLAEAMDMPEAAHGLHQFINASPWDWLPVRRALLRWVEERDRTRAWVIAPAEFPRRGEHCAGVHHRFVPALGRTVNCQVGVGVFLAGTRATVPVDWKLLLPGRWDQDEQLRVRARIPAGLRAGTVVGQALDLIDSLTARSGSARLPVVADLSGERGAGWLLRALQARRHDFLIAVPDALPTRTRPGPVVGARGVLGFEGTQTMPLGGGPAHLLSRPVSLPGADAALPACRLFTLSDPTARQPGRLWITNMVRESHERLCRLASKVDVAPTVDALAGEFGMTAFEGRSYPGWHHHMSLVSAAFAFNCLRQATDGLLTPCSTEAA
ncbi:transposase [Streptomyces sp. CSDS2]|uniref:IS701 family transposase n=1 Tax=Streptomyces sp. CSDS2 TaxID=3055051 RepID=UPI0025AF9E08|nr:transposase [Streptomyces sp. CSDS2]MDN3259379.1 transposase [Streptomyces sp. CSDS2]